MKKYIALILSFVTFLGLAGCQFSKPTFDNFAEYRDDFSTVRDFILDCNFDLNNTEMFTVYLNSDIVTITDKHIKDASSLLDAVNNLHTKGFTYVAVCDDYMIFWEDETGYYGVLWSQNSERSIKRLVKESFPYRKTRKLVNEWYEVGVLDSI